MRVGKAHVLGGIRNPAHDSFLRICYASAARRHPGFRGPGGVYPAVTVASLLDKRLVFVTGKGGVGKSTVAVALGLLAARRGLRTIVAEVAYQDRVARVFGRDDSHFNEVELADGLYTISIDPQHAIEEYLRLQVPVRPLADVLSGSRMFQYFAAATPGLGELVTIGKVWELAQLERRTRNAARYDLVIVDAPATGHGVATMRAPKTFADIARVGPIAHQGRAIHAMITDAERTGVIAVALPEEMPVNETLSLRDALRRELGVSLDRVVVNGLYEQRFSAQEEVELEQAVDTAGTPSARAALRAALSEHLRARAQREQVARLEEGTGRAPVLLPFLFEADLDVAAYERLSRLLEAAL
jgi:anion-transporting  ArsA/GET3 family ATPase